MLGQEALFHIWAFLGEGSGKSTYSVFRLLLGGKKYLISFQNFFWEKHLSQNWNFFREGGRKYLISFWAIMEEGSTFPYFAFLGEIKTYSIF